MTDEASAALFDDCFERLELTSDCKENIKRSGVCGFTNSGIHVSCDPDLHSSDNPVPSDSLMCLQSKQYFDLLEIPMSKSSKKTVQELNKYTLKQLQVLAEDLTRSVEEVSSELVQLLLENDALQQESDARNIAIEQLLKITVKTSDGDLKPIQMSIVLPDENSDDIT